MPARQIAKQTAIRIPEIIAFYYLWSQTQKKRAQAADFSTLSDEDAITLDPVSSTNKTQYIKTLANNVQKAVDFKNPAVNSFANRIAGEYGKEGKYNISQVAAIFEYIHNNWRYVSDPKGVDYLERASEVVISDLKGDCDSFATLMCASFLAIGGTPRWNAGFSDKGGHAWTDIYVGKSKLDFERQKNKLISDFRFTGLKDAFKDFSDYISGKGYEINYVRDDTGFYIPADWWARHIGGPLFPNMKFWVAIWPKTGDYKVIRDK